MEDLKTSYKEGQEVSPVLPKGTRNFLIDIDGTICEDVPNERPDRMKTADPIPGAKDQINKWYENGHFITFFTSRTRDHKTITENWLDRHGFKYHGVIYGKPRGGNYHWVDNHIVRATRFQGEFTDLVEKKKTIEVFDDE